MLLDTLQSRERQISLLDRYGALLTDHQREVMDLYLRQDWSLSEVGRQLEVSRAAVHDLIRRTTQSLEDYEARLGLLLEQDERRDHLARELRSIRKRLELLESKL